mmetsp:Transcript_15441/g.27060  ORF Transcript_15441/g.27060 Transcript_15441/m.27060 type:complete len:84 (+) Transcript_15441:76-327(+)
MVSQDLAKQRSAEAALNLTGRASKYKATRMEAAKEASHAKSERPVLEEAKSAMKLDQMMAPYSRAPCPDLPAEGEQGQRRLSG